MCRRTIPLLGLHFLKNTGLRSKFISAAYSVALGQILGPSLGMWASPLKSVEKPSLQRKEWLWGLSKSLCKSDCVVSNPLKSYLEVKLFYHLRNLFEMQIIINANCVCVCVCVCDFKIWVLKSCPQVGHIHYSVTQGTHWEKTSTCPGHTPIQFSKEQLLFPSLPIWLSQSSFSTYRNQRGKGLFYPSSTLRTAFPETMKIRRKLVLFQRPTTARSTHFPVKTSTRSVSSPDCFKCTIFLLPWHK
jgi:hypothetical protein